MRSQPSRFGIAAVSGLALTLASAPAARADLPGTGIVKDVIGGATGWTFGTPGCSSEWPANSRSPLSAWLLRRR
ncbi:MAG: hypothetical protein LC750_14570 [Actinobacteria bacterium]|nr:hypothetical protein [Actinomycetota bacterium]